MNNTILIVDDEANVLTALKRALLNESYDILVAHSGEEGLEVIKRNHVKVVISDEMMPGMSGSAFLASVKKLFPETIRIMLTGHASIEAAMNAVNEGEIYRFFSKPWDDIQLKMAIRSAMEKFNLAEENRKLLITVKKQANELMQLEEKHPGITNLKKDEAGNVILEEISADDKDISVIMSEISSQSDS